MDYCFLSSRGFRRPMGRQRGVILVISLILLWVLTAIAVSAMLVTATDLRVAANSNFRVQALEGSERARILAIQAMESYLEGGSNWSPGLTAIVNARGLEIVDPDRDLAGVVGEADNANCTVDLRYKEDRGDLDDFEPNDIAADICVLRRGAIVSRGSGAAVAEGYGGLGVGAAGGGGSLFLTVRARAQGVGGAVSTTGSDYRHIISR